MTASRSLLTGTALRCVPRMIQRKPRRSSREWSGGTSSPPSSREVSPCSTSETDEGREQSRPIFMKNKHYWDKVYQGKLDTKKFRQFSNAELSKILAHFPHAKIAFDLGCGQGFLMGQLEKRGMKAYGVEFSEEAKKQSRASEKIQIADLEKFTPPFKVDIFFLKFVLAFVCRKDFLRNLQPFIKEKGGIVILTPVGRGLVCCIGKRKLKEMCRWFEVVKEETWYEDKKKNRKLVLLILRTNSR